jgi:hypothetical protein
MVMLLLVATLVFEISRGPIRGNPTQQRNDDLMEHVRDIRKEAEHEHMAKEASRVSRRDRSKRGWRSLVSRIFRR